MIALLTVNDESFTREKFCSSLNFTIMYGKFFDAAFDKNKTMFCIYIDTQNGIYKISRENLSGLSKIDENCETFLPHNTRLLWY